MTRINAFIPLRFYAFMLLFTKLINYVVLGILQSAPLVQKKEVPHQIFLVDHFLYGFIITVA